MISSESLRTWRKSPTFFCDGLELRLTSHCQVLKIGTQMTRGPLCRSHKNTFHRSARWRDSESMTFTTWTIWCLTIPSLLKIYIDWLILRLLNHSHIPLHLYHDSKVNIKRLTHMLTWTFTSKQRNQRDIHFLDNFKMKRLMWCCIKYSNLSWNVRYIFTTSTRWGRILKW